MVVERTPDDGEPDDQEDLPAWVSERGTNRNTYFWWARRPEGITLADRHEIEVRIDLESERIAAFVPPSGWRVAHKKIDEGMVFMRRFQPLTDEAVEAMLIEVSTLAFRLKGRFHSWMHKPELSDW